MLYALVAPIVPPDYARFQRNHVLRKHKVRRANAFLDGQPSEMGKDAMRLMILNGPNLNLLGVREPHIYGHTTLAAIEKSCQEFAQLAGVDLSFHQSNHEGELVDLVQSARENADALIINPAAYSFTSIALFDALKVFDGPIFEVHISNIHARDELHRHSKLSAAVTAVIAGAGPYGYILAMQAALRARDKLPESLPAPIRLGPT